jgi:alpha-glucosidase
VTRYGRADTSYGFDRAARHGLPVDLALGTRRARAAALLMLALPGSAYVYQGDELGLWEVEDIPDHLRQDPTWLRSDGADRGRDGCRVPLPWEGEEQPFGFSPARASAAPWLDVQPDGWRELTVAAQSGTPGSHLELYREALRIRRTRPGLGDGPMRWWDGIDGRDVLDFVRPGGFRCIVDLGTEPVRLPPDHGVLLASGPLTDGTLPPDTAVWLGEIVWMSPD